MRRPLDSEHHEVVTDFRAPFEVPGADAAVCALGTTIAAAGSRDAFYAVDHDAVLQFAGASRAAGINRFLVVTAVGADPRARVFYSRVKGETERDLAALRFVRLDIAQPGLLLGSRKEQRPVERILQGIDPLARRFMGGPLNRFAGIKAETVARALLHLCEQAERGVFRHRNRDLLRIANL